MGASLRASPLFIGFVVQLLRYFSNFPISEPDVITKSWNECIPDTRDYLIEEFETTDRYDILVEGAVIIAW